MPGSIIKIDYHRIRLGHLTLPFYHTYIEVDEGKKVKRFGFTAKHKKYWPISLLFPITGYIINEPYTPEFSEIISRNKKKTKKLLREIEKSTWHHYHLFFHNCFRWRNSILKKAGIKIPKDHYWKPETKNR